MQGNAVLHELLVNFAKKKIRPRQEIVHISVKYGETFKYLYFYEKMSLLVGMNCIT